ncbi:MAG: right-handed parallel beta-helix repeat-containing protein, partial [Candidatus Udaeobacter sp.]
MQAPAATITVTNTNDSGPGSLRQALAVANDGDMISFAVTGTITLTSGGLVIDKSVTISGPGADRLSINGNHAALQSVFSTVPDKTVTISGLTITNGGGGIYNDHGALTVSNCVVNGNSEGGIFNDHGTSTVSNCVVSGNLLGGLSNDASHGPNEHTFDGVTMTITNSIVSDNSGTGVSNTGTVTILNSTLSGNSADLGGGGGGISNGSFKTPGSLVTISNSTISGNSAQAGGGIFNEYGLVIVLNSTLSGNSAVDGGGGIANYAGAAQIANSTISGNSAPQGGGGGIYNVGGQYGATIETGNTILNAGASGENIFNNGGTVTSHGYNISSDDGSGYLTGPGDQINT